MKNKRVLITGGGGSIGVHVVAHILNNRDWDVILLDSFHHKGYKERIIELLQEHPDWKKRITVFQHDLNCEITWQMRRKIGVVNYVLHLAALSDVFLSVENPQYVIENNIRSTLTILEYARTIGNLESFIYFSTDEVYGPVKKGYAHKEWSTHKPSNAYSASKAASEDICYAYWRSYDVPLIITNTMNNFGEMQSASKFPVIVQKKVSAGEVVEIHGNEKECGSRYYIHSRNAADALLFIIGKGAYKHNIGSIDMPLRYHILGDECLSNLSMARTIAKIMGKELKYKIVDFHKDNPAHDIHYGMKDNNLKKAGWKSPLDFITSLKNTIEWQEKHKEWI